ncbi:MAG: CotS family spore coat protein [Sporolactobacillus sp.]|jgi:spore coat-associated protein S|nr:CotS family spore coat protein [Sporolactobacillus sp.]MCI1881305.1 CotS family spore coat protein [Sporolactobacillus sp.]
MGSSSPEEINTRREALRHILELYPIEVQSIRLLFVRRGRVKWRIKAKEGDFFLRRETMNPKRMVFIAAAHRHLQENGLPIAKLIATKNGALCLSEGDHAYVLYEAVSGEPVHYYSPQYMLKAAEFAARFHQASSGFDSPEGSRRRTRAGKWQKLYRWKLQELEDHKKLILEQSESEFSRLFLTHIDTMMRRGREALSELERLEAGGQAEAFMASGRFCQQDFTMARLIMKDGDIFMKDLHSITIDLPVRDLRILLNKIMKKLAVWDDDLAGRMLQAYDRIHPLAEEQYRMLWADLKFPHLFCALAHKYFLGQKKTWNDEKYLINLKNIVDMERSKEHFLNHFDDMMAIVKGGD